MSFSQLRDALLAIAPLDKALCRARTLALT